MRTTWITEKGSPKDLGRLSPQARLNASGTLTPLRNADP
jgi:hypothetical protein